MLQTFINDCTYLHGPPKEILTDDETQVAIKIFRAINKILKVKQLFTTLHHPERNGMIGCFHKYLKERLKFKAIDHQLDHFKGDDWDIHIPNISHSYNIREEVQLISSDDGGGGITFQRVSWCILMIIFFVK